MTNELKPCGCGKVPMKIMAGSISPHRFYAHGDCCGQWAIFFWYDNSEFSKAAIEAWNAAPRPEPKVCVWTVRGNWYTTGCGDSFMRKNNYCPNCGGQVKETSDV